MNRQQDLGTKITVALNFSPDVTEPSTILCPALYLYNVHVQSVISLPIFERRPLFFDANEAIV